MQNKPEFSCDAIIVNYNAGPLLAEAIASLLLQQVSRIIVVDNASTDGSLALAEKLPANGALTVIRNERNLGFAAACNLGARASSARRLLFLNPDCTMAPGALQSLLTVLDSSPDIGMAGGFLCNPDGTEQAGGRRVFPTPRRAFIRAFGLSILAEVFPHLFSDFLLHRELLPSTPITVEAISGACMLVKREVVEQVGLWDEGYFLHCEDLDWCMRFQQHGYRVVFVPDAPVIHRQGACSRSRPFFVEWHKHQGMLRFYHKFFRRNYPSALMGLVTLGVWLHFVVVVIGHGFQLARQHFMARTAPALFPASRGHTVPNADFSPATPAANVVILTGATSQIASFLLPKLFARGYAVHALSRKRSHAAEQPGVIWHCTDIEEGQLPPIRGETLIHLAPLPLLPPLLSKLAVGPLKRVIAFGSTSRFSKQNSLDPDERALALGLMEAERSLAEFCEPRGIAWTVFRPTLIYGCGMDKNVAVITRFIRRFGFFPVIGETQGLRQPVHADDLAGACVAIMENPAAFNRAYDLSGGETLSYRAMVERIFQAEGKKPRFLAIPLSLFRSAMETASWWPGYRYLSGEMARRMAMDLCFDHAEATRDFGYAPRQFEPPRPAG